MRNKILVAVIFMFSKQVFSVGIPMLIPTDAIKISESHSYSCNNGKAMQLLDSGQKQYIVYGNKTVACHDDNLWLDGKALSFVDLVSLAAAEASKVNE